jgi:hypothetical protein
LFNHLQPFSTIVVTGPQRSGTKFTAEIIAAELGLQYVHESEFGVHALDHCWKLLDQPVVIQAPALSAYCHLLPPHVAVVFMLRELGQILASQERIAGWRDVEEPRELAKYFRLPGGEPIAQLKYAVWEQFQKPALTAAGKPFLELRFPTDVENHPRFVSAAERRDWLPHQTGP